MQRNTMPENMQIVPARELTPYIKHYLFLESAGKHARKLRLFSDGNTGLVFCVDKSLATCISDSLQKQLPATFLYGQISGYKDLHLTGAVSLVIIVFQPDGINKLLGLPAVEVRDKMISAPDVFGSQLLQLHDQLFSSTSIQNRLQLLNSFFLTFISKPVSANPVLVTASLDFIVKNKGNSTVAQLVKHTGYTERHIERAFTQSIGISPKKFGNIIKLHHFLKLLKHKSADSNITAFCYEAGYFDQSHLVREFRKYTGITPTQYLQLPTRLTTNFIELGAVNQSMSGLYNLPQ